MSAGGLSLSPQQFAAAFPFHLALDEELRVLQCGAVLNRLYAGLVAGAALEDHFTVQRPVIKRLDFDAIRRHDKSLFVLQHRDGALRLRGEFVAHGRQLIFLGSPWVARMVDVGRLGLLLDDFAVHDPVVDLLFLLQTKDKALADTQELSRRLRASQQRLAEAQQLAKLGSWMLDPRSGALECSAQAREIYGLAAVAAAPTLDTLLALVPAAQRAGLREAIAQAERADAPVELEHRVCMPDGTERWVHLNLQRAAEEGVAMVRATVRDETTRKKSGQQLKLAHDIARELAADVDPERAVATILSSIGAQLGWHAAVCWRLDDGVRLRSMGTWAAPDDAAAQAFVAAIGPDGQLPCRHLDAACVAASPLWRAIAEGGAEHPLDAAALVCGLRASVVVPVDTGEQPVALEFFSRSPSGIDGEVQGFMRAIADQLAQYLRRKQAETALRHAAHHDALTGLSSRLLLRERLVQAIQRATRQQTRVAVLFMDLDRFKHINDSLGHSAGDVLLQACARRLRDGVRACDTVARFGGDEFVVVLEDLTGAADVVAPLAKALGQFATPFEVNGRELPTTISVGVSMFPDDGRDAETLLMNADAAMYRAKEQGPGRHHFYSASMNEQGQARLALESALPRALERNELFLAYQPKVDIATGRITGAEALMRWRHPTMGAIQPLQFIPVAEDTGLIDRMGRWALEVACRQARQWQDRGHPIQVSVNLSARQLDRPELAEEVARILCAERLDPAQLELEITESGVMRNPALAAAQLRKLRDLGVSLAIDDFGTGYSSLSYLRSFPLCTLKIDRSFIKDLPLDDDAANLTGGIIALAHRLRMKVVAEGVETLGQLGFLRANQCDEFQGYYLSRPITAQEMTLFLERGLHHLWSPALVA